MLRARGAVYYPLGTQLICDIFFRIIVRCNFKKIQFLPRFGPRQSRGSRLTAFFMPPCQKHFWGTASLFLALRRTIPKMGTVRRRLPQKIRFWQQLLFFSIDLTFAAVAKTIETLRSRCQRGHSPAAFLPWCRNWY